MSARDTWIMLFTLILIMGFTFRVESDRKGFFGFMGIVLMAVSFIGMLSIAMGLIP